MQASNQIACFAKNPSNQPQPLASTYLFEGIWLVDEFALRQRRCSATNIFPKKVWPCPPDSCSLGLDPLLRWLKNLKNFDMYEFHRCQNNTSKERDRKEGKRRGKNKIPSVPRNAMSC